MGEADGVELRLGDRAGDQRRARARAGQADGELERVERVAGAFEGRLARPGVAGRVDSDDRKRLLEAGCGLVGAGDDLEGPVPDRTQGLGRPDREEGRNRVGDPSLPGFGRDLGPDPRRIPERDGQGSDRVSDSRPPRRAGGREGSAARAG